MNSFRKASSEHSDSQLNQNLQSVVIHYSQLGSGDSDGSRQSTTPNPNVIGSSIEYEQHSRQLHSSLPSSNSTPSEHQKPDVLQHRHVREFKQGPHQGSVPQSGFKRKRLPKSQHQATSKDPSDRPTQIEASTPFPSYIPTRIEPCALDAQSGPQSFHLLSCGHIVAVDDDDRRCGLNCLHVAIWSMQKLNRLPAANVDLGDIVPLDKGLTKSLGYRPVRSDDGYNPTPGTGHVVVPAENCAQKRDYIYCEMCQGLPMSSYDICKPDHDLRRAFGISRSVLQDFVGYNSNDVDHVASRLFAPTMGVRFNWENTHRLRCGHEVWSDPVRPCASNCAEVPQCLGRVFPRNIRQGDAILCSECIFRAEMVYKRYESMHQSIVQPQALPEESYTPPSPAPQQLSHYHGIMNIHDTRMGRKRRRRPRQTGARLRFS